MYNMHIYMQSAEKKANIFPHDSARTQVSSLLNFHWRLVAISHEVKVTKHELLGTQAARVKNEVDQFLHIDSLGLNVIVTKVLF